VWLRVSKIFKDILPGAPVNQFLLLPSGEQKLRSLRPIVLLLEVDPRVTRD